MNPAMWISKTGVQAQDEKLQAIANNLANANTVGFKRDRVVFEDLFYSVEQQPGTQRADNNTLAPSGVQLGNGTCTWSAPRKCSPRARCKPPATRWTWP
jgi:flagellar basal-body rod protein FlgG